MYGERQPKRNPRAVSSRLHLNVSGKCVIQLLGRLTNDSDGRGER